MVSLVGNMSDAIAAYLRGRSGTGMITLTVCTTNVYTILHDHVCSLHLQRNPGDVLKIKSDMLGDIVGTGGMGDVYEMLMKNASGRVEKVRFLVL